MYVYGNLELHSHHSEVLSVTLAGRSELQGRPQLQTVSRKPDPHMCPHVHPQPHNFSLDFYKSAILNNKEPTLHRTDSIKIRFISRAILLTTASSTNHFPPELIHLFLRAESRKAYPPSVIGAEICFPKCPKACNSWFTGAIAPSHMMPSPEGTKLWQTWVRLLIGTRRTILSTLEVIHQRLEASYCKRRL